MKRRMRWAIGFLGVLISVSGCASLTEPRLNPGVPDDLPGCYAPFPDKSWKAVHQIEAVIQERISSSLIGITAGEPSERRIHSLLLTPEGFVLFEAELREGAVIVSKAMPPFDSLAFAPGLIEDVSLIFLAPPPTPSGWRRGEDGTWTCRWETPGEVRTEVRGSGEQGWKILRRNDQGEITREVFLKGPFVRGMASHMELRAFGPAGYRLKMTLLQLEF